MNLLKFMSCMHKVCLVYYCLDTLFAVTYLELRSEFQTGIAHCENSIMQYGEINHKV